MLLYDCKRKSPIAQEYVIKDTHDSDRINNGDKDGDDQMNQDDEDQDNIVDKSRNQNVGVKLNNYQRNKINQNKCQ